MTLNSNNTFVIDSTRQFRYKDYRRWVWHFASSFDLTYSFYMSMFLSYTNNGVDFRKNTIVDIMHPTSLVKYFILIQE